MKIKIKTNALAYIALLKKQHGGLAIAGSRTVNDAAEMVQSEYKKNLKSNFKIKNKYTLNAPKIFFSKPISKSTGNFRPITGINSRIYVQKMKGGKDHYLKKQEEGATTKGTAITAGKVAMPLKAARTSKSVMKPIGGRYRIYNNLIQPFISSNGKELNLAKFSPAQKWAMAHKYMIDTKMFIMDMGARGQAFFGRQAGRIVKVRDLQKSTVQIEGRGLFQKSLNLLSNSVMENIFIKVASRVVQKK